MPLKGYDGSSFADIDSNDSPAGGPFEQGRVYAYGGQYQNRIYPDIPEAGISRWSFDNADTNSGTALDVWNTNDGSIINGATTGQTGANITYDTGEAYKFDGTDDYIDVDSTPSITEGDFSVSVWAKSTGPSNRPTAISQGNPAQWPDELFILYIGDEKDGSQQAHVWWEETALTTPIPTDGAYHHYTLTKDGDTLTLYIDGAEAETATTNGNTWTSSSTTIGAANRDGTQMQYYNGGLDDVRIYNKVLTDDEANRLYNVGAI